MAHFLVCGCGHQPWVLGGTVWGHGVPSPHTLDRKADAELALQPCTGPHLFTVTTDKLQHCAKGLKGARGQHHRMNPPPPTQIPPLPHRSPPHRGPGSARHASPAASPAASIVPCMPSTAQHPHRDRQGPTQPAPCPEEDDAGKGGSGCLSSGAGTALPLQLQAQKWLSAVVSGNS